MTVALSGRRRCGSTYVATAGTATAHVIFDVTGYFTADATGATYHTLTPARILDTRAQRRPDAARSQPPRPRVRGRPAQGGVAARRAIAVTGNLTVVGQTKVGNVALTTVAAEARRRPRRSTSRLATPAPTG